MEMGVWRDAQARAGAAAEGLRESLEDLGLPERVWRSIRPVVTGSGTSYVYVGVVRADAVERITAALRDAGPPAPPAPQRPVRMRWLDTGSGPGVMVPVVGEEATAEPNTAMPPGHEPG
ncbi:hypothetical protein [Streptomyces sp. NPDC004726]